jgi:tetratricopeptide (TPR) repeat protein
VGALAALVFAAAAAPAVKAWEGVETIPTYEEGAPDPNPPFDLFASGRFNYPYTLRENLTNRRRDQEWRTLNLENEYLRVSVLPDLGGRLWRCVDKVNGRSLFYANPSLKFAQVAYRGAWATFGIEWNFPVSHNWVTSSPVDHALVTNPDGSASIVVGNLDLVYGMEWRVALTLRPGRAVLEQDTTLENPDDVRHRFYWWTNAAVQAWDDSELVFPMRYTASHGFAQVDTWPVDAKGTDLRRPGNHTKGAVSLFSHGSREPFMGVYHPRTRSGVAHYAAPNELPAKKVWSWGVDADGLDWRRALSDDGSAEVEIQAGLFRDQETYAFLEPGQSLRFHEDWLPVREIGAFSRATPHAVLRIGRETIGGRKQVSIGAQVTQTVRAGRLRLRRGDELVIDAPFALTPAATLQRGYPGLDPDAEYTVELVGDGGRVLLEHAEGRLDVVPPDDVSLGPQPHRPVPPAESRSEGDVLELGRAQELEGKLLRAFDTYEDGLRRLPASAALLGASGRLAVALKRYELAAPRLAAALGADSADAPSAYALGLAQARLGRASAARSAFAAAARSPATQAMSLVQIARLDAAAGDTKAALDALQRALETAPHLVAAGALEVALLRRQGRTREATERLRTWRAIDPTRSFLRHEAVLLGGADGTLWTHLAGDAQRVLGLAEEYVRLGAWDDALALLERTYPTGAGVHAEPGAVAPQEHPELAYYRAYCLEKLGRSATEAYAVASRLSTTYVFPQRATSVAVLERAVAVEPRDATAWSLLGSLRLSGGDTEAAIAAWETSLRLDPRRPTLHRNLGLTLIHAGGRFERAREVLEAGRAADPRNVEVYLALDQALGALGRPVADRVAALAAYPDAAGMPGVLVFKLALALVEAGRFDDALALLPGRFFAREEFGTNVRQVYVEIRLQQALFLARAGRGALAVDILRRVGEPVPGLAFTSDGLAPFVDGARARFLAGEVQELAGDAAAARDSWAKAAASADAYPQPDAAFAYLAARRLGGPAEADARNRLEAALRSWENRLVVGTNYPGANAAGQGWFLKALGRESPAQAKFQEALLLPDKVMSHYLSRAGLRP